LEWKGLVLEGIFQTKNRELQTSGPDTWLLVEGLVTATVLASIGLPIQTAHSTWDPADFNRPIAADYLAGG